MNFPNLLSVSRVILIIPIIFLFEINYFLTSCFIFIFASLTDFLDGYLARKNNLESDLGGLLDLLADKLFVSILLIWLSFKFDSYFLLICSILIISREISVSYVRLFLVTKSKEISEISSDISGKLKTSFQMTGLGFLLISSLNPFYIYNLSLALIFLSTLLSWYSFYSYLKKWIV
jgi:CDP-diacylglycerol--glycerol-3-phosphate 3-phosphatidyltransferase